MPTESTLQRLKSSIDTWLGWVLVVLMAVSVVNVLWQVFTRYILGAPSTFTQELASYLLIWIGLLGASYAVGRRAHLALDLLPQRLSGRRKRLLDLVIMACVVIFAFSAMIVGGLRLVYIQLKLGQTSPTLGIPLGYVYLVLPLSGLFICFYAAAHAARRRAGTAAAPEGNGAAAEEDAQVDKQMPSGQERPPVPE